MRLLLWTVCLVLSALPAWGAAEEAAHDFAGLAELGDVSWPVALVVLASLLRGYSPTVTVKVKHESEK